MPRSSRRCAKCRRPIDDLDERPQAEICLACVKENKERRNRERPCRSCGMKFSAERPGQENCLDCRVGKRNRPSLGVEKVRRPSEEVWLWMVRHCR